MPLATTNSHPAVLARRGLVERFLPVYEISDAVATVVRADRHTTWQALMDVDLIALGHAKPVIGVLGAMRMLPEVVSHLVRGEPLPTAPKRMTLRDTAGVPSQDGGWTLLGEEPDDEIALGLVGRFWRPIIDYAQVPPEEFTDFSEPGFAKTVYSLSVRELAPDSTLLRAEMRVATTDDHARKWFSRYWTFGVGSGAHVLVAGLIEEARERAEAAAAL